MTDSIFRKNLREDININAANFVQVKSSSKNDLDEIRKYKIAKIFLYMFYGHSISTSLNDHIKENIHRIAINSINVIDHSILFYGFLNIFMCIFLIRSLYINRKTLWNSMYMFYFMGIIFYKLTYGFKSFVHYPRQNKNEFLDLKYCDDHFIMLDLKIVKLIFESIFECIAFVSFYVINTKLTKYWTVKDLKQMHNLNKSNDMIISSIENPNDKIPRSRSDSKMSKPRQMTQSYSDDDNQSYSKYYNELQIRVISKEPISKEPISKEPISKEPISKEAISKKLISKKSILKGPISEEPIYNNEIDKRNVGFSNVPNSKSTQLQYR